MIYLLTNYVDTRWQ